MPKTKKTSAKTNSKALVVHDVVHDTANKEVKKPLLKTLQKRHLAKGAKIVEAYKNNKAIRDAIHDLGVKTAILAYTMADNYAKSKKKADETKVKPFIDFNPKQKKNSSKTLAIESPSKTLAIESPSDVYQPYKKFVERIIKKDVTSALEKQNKTLSKKGFSKLIATNIKRNFDKEDTRCSYIISDDFKKISNENQHKFINETINMGKFSEVTEETRKKVMSIANDMK